MKSQNWKQKSQWKSFFYTYGTKWWREIIRETWKKYTGSTTWPASGNVEVWRPERKERETPTLWVSLYMSQCNFDAEKFSMNSKRRVYLKSFRFLFSFVIQNLHSFSGFQNCLGKSSNLTTELVEAIK